MWCVKLTDSQRDALRALIKAQGELGTSLRGALEGLDYARWDDLPDANLPWERVAQLASAQGIDEADVVWDLAAGMPSAPRGALVKRPVSRRARKAARR
jgi:hypothetical protein